MSINISIIVPIYNTSSFLVRCLDSLIDQSEKEIEILLIDDGSTDDSNDICLKYSEKDSKFKYFYKTNGGLSSARNYGLQKATGKYVFLLDSDDYLPENALKTCFDIAEAKNVDLLNFGYTYVVGDFQEIRNSVFPKNQIFGKPIFLELLKKDTLSKKLLWFSWTYFYNLNFIKQNSLSFDELILLGEDSIFNLKCLLKAKSIYSINDSLYFYVHNDNSLTQSKYRVDLIKKFESQFNARLKVYENNNILKDEYLIDIAQNYMEHAFFEIVLNEYNDNKNSSKIILNKLSKLRNEEFILFSILNYKISKTATRNKKILIWLFKNRLFLIFHLLYKSKL